MLSDHDTSAMIPVKDLEKSRRWYEDVLGLTPVIDEPSGITYKSGAGVFSIYPTQFLGAKHTLMGWVVPDIEAAVDELASKGITFEQYDFEGLKTDGRGIAELEGERGAWFKDPDGNILSVWQSTTT